MKIIFICLLFASIFFARFSFTGAETDKKEYEIKISVKGLKDTTCLLAYHYGDKQYIKDSARADKKGNLVFKGEGELAGGVYMLVLPDKRYFEFVVSEQKFSLETEEDQLITKMKVKGSEENRLFYEHLQYLYPRGKLMDSLKKEMERVKNNKDSAEMLRNKTRQVAKEVEDFKKDLQKKYPHTFVAKMLKAMSDIEVPPAPKRADGTVDSFFRYHYYKDHFWDNIDFSDDRILRSPVFHQKLKQYIQSTIVQIPDSINKAADFVIAKAQANKELFKYCIWWITNTYESSQIMGMDAVFVHMAFRYYTPDQAYWADTLTLVKIRTRAMVLQPILIGKVAPNLTMKDVNNQWKSLHSVDAKYTILVFWDPDCGHCKKEIPELYEIYREIKPLGVEIFAVCTEVEMDKWKKFIEEHKLDWINVADPTFQTDFRNLYDVFATPKIFVLNRKKEIIAKQIDHKQVKEMIERAAKTDVKN